MGRFICIEISLSAAYLVPSLLFDRSPFPLYQLVFLHDVGEYLNSIEPNATDLEPSFPQAIPLTVAVLEVGNAYLVDGMSNQTVLFIGDPSVTHPVAVIHDHQEMHTLLSVLLWGMRDIIAEKNTIAKNPYDRKVGFLSQISQISYLFHSADRRDSSHSCHRHHCKSGC